MRGWSKIWWTPAPKVRVFPARAGVVRRGKDPSELAEAGIIEKRDKGRLVRAAARSDVGK
ncbi:hypothetical protein [Saccharomonospora saliphila]|uniref:hypothetical protein n=1 Tax=Saccharomonospora saliphila TaxID=369829 RepID=UPI0003A43E41